VITIDQLKGKSSADHLRSDVRATHSAGNLRNVVAATDRMLKLTRIGSKMR
jgi:hypothetical protein